MAYRQIITEENPMLRKKSRPVTSFDARLSTLIDDMIETMRKAEGVGLAAVQVGVLRRVVVMDCGDGLLELVNPEIIEQSGRWQTRLPPGRRAKRCAGGAGGLSFSSGEKRDHPTPAFSESQGSGQERKMVCPFRNRA